MGIPLWNSLVNPDQVCHRLTQTECRCIFSSHT